ncbi:hypothetical protein RN001_003875 [Aquatica leii]|uniref:Uncharacterized protein n=1 Tax=Aquatica leii TaxID=1421715 RepID=A0AAN7PIY8_9COLE|nr:hypothetical protein RN001_003875 [Aquatica leii]
MGGERCLTPFNETGECTQITECPRLLAAFAVVDPQDIDVLTEFVCEYPDDDPDDEDYVLKVCCGNSPNFTVFANASQEKPDFSNISDYRICGLQHRDDYILSDDKLTADEFPWLAAIINATLPAQRKGVCGGTLINTRYVLTSAQCTESFKDENIMLARLGDYNLNTDIDCFQLPEFNVFECTDVQEYGVEKIIKHPFYNAFILLNDIALLRLNETVKYSDYVRPICLPTSEDELTYYGITLYSTGFGQNDKDVKGPNTKKKIPTTLTPIHVCDDKISLLGYANLYTEYHFCSEDIQNSTYVACVGDEGGPVMFSKKFQWFIEEICKTPTGQKGECVPLASCEILLWSFANPKKEMRNYLKKFLCSKTTKNGRFVCCPVATDVLVFEDEKDNWDPNSIQNIKKLVNVDTCGKSNRYVNSDGLISLYDFPWLVKIKISENQEKFRVLCTGVLITERYVMYTAQCHHLIVEKGPYMQIQLDVYNGYKNNCNTTSSSYEKNCSAPQNYEYDDYKVHPFYDPVTKLNDIAILRLNRGVVFSEFIQPICLPLIPELPKHGLVQTSGWNETFLESELSVKTTYTSILISNYDCKAPNKQGDVITTYDMCTINGVPPENEVIGYPVTSLYKNQWYLLGFTSRGKEPRIHTRVQNYLQWIKETIDEEWCFTPFNETGECIQITECPRLMAEFAVVNPKDKDYLNEFVCKYPDDDPDGEDYVLKVCCGNSPNFTVFANTSQEEPDFSNISDYRFCGLQHRDDYFLSDDKLTADEFPWLAAIINATLPAQREGVCGGTLINNRYVLTSAQCTKLFKNKEIMLARLGDYNLNTEEDCFQLPESNDFECTVVQEYGIEKVINHPFYSSYLLLNDIALLRLNETVKFSDYVRPICLPTSEDELAYYGITLYSTGFGDNEPDVKGPKTKKKIRTTLTPVHVCDDKLSSLGYENLYTEYHFCSEDRKNATYVSCVGDEGGPVMFSKKFRWYIEEICKTPTGHKGECVPLASCEILLWSFANPKKEMRNYLKKFVCSKTTKNGRFVCCPVVTDVLVFEDEKDNWDPNSIQNIKKLVNVDTCGKSNRYVNSDGLISLYDFPWLVKIKISENQEKFRVLCTGVLITERYVMYTAQCHHLIVEKGPYMQIQLDVYNGYKNNCNTTSSSYEKKCSAHQNYEYDDYKVHPFYDPVTKLNDIAILRLNRGVVFSEFIQPICLPLIPELPKHGLIQTSGWNETFLNSELSVKTTYTSTLISNYDCKALNKQGDVITTYDMCTINGVPPENEVIGYPVTSLYKNQWYLLGFTSRGKEPRIHTRVQNYLQWIKETIDEEWCFTPFNETGECIQITECPRLMAEFAVVNPKDKDYLNEFVCKYPDDDPDGEDYVLKVCCGNSPNFTVFANTSQEEPDFSNISDYRFCGLQHRDDYFLSDDKLTADEFPWLAAIINATLPAQREGVCGGTLINTRYVLTSAQCTKLFKNKEIMLARLGDYNLNTEEDCFQLPESNDFECTVVQEYGIEKVINHPFYSSYLLFNDIALLRLNETVKFSDYVRPICLPTSEDELAYYGITLYSTGFGDNEPDVKGPKTKKKIRTTLTPVHVCDDKLSSLGYENLYTEYHFCSEDRKNATYVSCVGDEGGPVMFSKKFRWYIEEKYRFGEDAFAPAETTERDEPMQGTIPEIIPDIETLTETVPEDIPKTLSTSPVAGPSGISVNKHTIELYRQVTPDRCIPNTQLPHLIIKPKICKTPTGQKGECVPLASCEILLWSFANPKKEMRNYLKKFLCSKTTKNGIFVCCPVATDVLVFEDEKDNWDPNSIQNIKKLVNVDTCGKSNRYVKSDGLISLNDFPWLVKIKISENGGTFRVLCTGVLITERYVMYTAQCHHLIVEKGPYMQIQLDVYNGYNNNCNTTASSYEKHCSAPQNYEYADYKVHPFYNPVTKLNDIAILRLNRGVLFSEFIQPICLPLIPKLPKHGLVQTSGWNETFLNSELSVKTTYTSTLISNYDCKALNKQGDVITTYDMCTINGVPPANEVIGYPVSSLYKNQWYLLGFTSRGKEPRIHTRVQNYLQWIKETIDGEWCFTPFNETGECIQITECPRLMAEFAVVNPKDKDYLNEFVCKYPDDDPDGEDYVLKVCCGNSPNFTVFANTSQEESNFSNISDYRFCGLQHRDDYFLSDDKLTADEFPWLAAIINATLPAQSEGVCGGTLINTRYVLTSTQCTKLFKNKEIMLARLGDYNLNTEEDCFQLPESKEFECTVVQEYGIEKVINHPFYSSYLPLNDIALLRLNETVKFSEICKTPTGHKGECVPLASCEILLWSFANPKKEMRNYLKKFVCSKTTKNGRFVCCPVATDVLVFEDEKDNWDPNSIQNIKKLVNVDTCGKSNRYVNSDGLISLYDFPWLVKIKISENQENFRVLCTGVLITERYVMYTAQCHHLIVEKGPYMQIKLDVYNGYKNNCNTTSSSYEKNCSAPQNYECDDYKVHPFYDPVTKLNDIAILRLNRGVVFSEFIQPICLPLIPDLPKHGLVQTSGWNETFLESELSVKTTYTSTLISNYDCKALNKQGDVITTYDMCTINAVPPENEVIGYPVTSLYKNQWYLLGFTSRGKEPRIHTRVQNYLQWIKETIDGELCLTPFNETGECTQITDCPRLMAEFAVVNPKDKDYLNEFVCKYPDDDPDGEDYVLKVCCGHSPNFTVFANTSQEEPDFSNISDYRFCGLQHRDDYILSDDKLTADEFPWLAAIINATLPAQREGVCGGTLINSRYVLTSVECTKLFKNEEIMLARLGDYNLNTEEDCFQLPDLNDFECTVVQEYGIEKVINHPFYSSYLLLNDIALLRLNETVQFSDYVRPICLPTSEDELAYYGITLYSTGFGDNEPDVKGPKTKKKIRTTLTPVHVCDDKVSLLGYVNLYTEYHFCSEDRENATYVTCDGDEGGPVMFSKKFQWFIEGISSTFGCGDGEPQSHTKVFKYLRWIKLNIED